MASIARCAPCAALRAAARSAQIPPRQAARQASTSARSSGRITSTAPTTDRVYTDRKAFLYRYYTHLLDASEVVLVFSPNNLTAAEWNAVRRAVALVPLPEALKGDTGAGDEARATLTNARTGLLAALARHRAEAASSGGPSADISPLLSGPTALLTIPRLSPSYLKSLLAAINKALDYRPPKAASAAGLAVSPRFIPLGGVIDGHRLLSTSEIAEVAKLPELSTLRAQLVGLLEMPGRQTVGVLGQAGGGALVRTLQGLEAGLKDKEGGEAQA